MGTRTRHNVML